MKMVSLILLSCFMTASCSSLTPYVAARHQSDPALANDGRDLGCAGIKRRGQLTLKVGWCRDADSENIAEIDIEYDLFGENDD